MRLFCLIAAMLLCAAACTPPVSKESLGLVDREISFEELLRDPDRYVGRYLLLGGAVVDARAESGGGSELEVVQFPTNQRGRITSTNTSAGRFIARDDVFRDPALYQGRLVTLVGKVSGKKTARLGEMDYLYPVLTVQELHLWSPREHPDATPVHFGIGIGIWGR